MTLRPSRCAQAPRARFARGSPTSSACSAPSRRTPSSGRRVAARASWTKIICDASRRCPALASARAQRGLVRRRREHGPRRRQAGRALSRTSISACSRAMRIPTSWTRTSPAPRARSPCHRARRGVSRSAAGGGRGPPRCSAGCRGRASCSRSRRAIARRAPGTRAIAAARRSRRSSPCSSARAEQRARPRGELTDMHEGAAPATAPPLRRAEAMWISRSRPRRSVGVTVTARARPSPWSLPRWRASRSRTRRGGSAQHPARRPTHPC